jgi:hypothetical protein
MKFCNMNGILYDKWNKKLDYLNNVNTKQKNIQSNKFHTCIKNIAEFINYDTWIRI